MKLSIFLFLLLFNNSCYHDSRNAFIPKEFEYPEEKIESGKTFVYQNLETSELSYKDFRLVNINGDNYCIVKSYDNHSTADSIISLNGEEIGNYNFFMSGNGKVLKGDKIQDTILHDNGKLGTHLTKWVFHAGQLTYIVSSKAMYIKDSSMNWQNKQIPCLVIQANGDMNLKANNDSSVNHNIQVKAIYYCGKGIGSLRFSIEFTDHTGKLNHNTWNLINIENESKLK